jgi:NAD(P)H dehydrogenase (quinone)
MNSYPVADLKTLTDHDAYLFGIPTRFGNMPAQFKVSRTCSGKSCLGTDCLQALWDRTGGLWIKGLLAGKFAGVFVSTGGLGGGQEETGYTLMTTLVHQGIVFVPLGYKGVFDELSNVDEVHGGK